jgi:hypothetical protein
MAKEKASELERPPTQTLQSAPTLYQRDENFESLYANNVNIDATVWDLKLVFGQFNSATRATAQPGIEQHTAITIPWLQAKLLAYYLQLHVAIHEVENGKIAVPDALIPPPPTPPQGEYQDNQQSIKAYRHMVEAQRQFVASLSEKR